MPEDTGVRLESATGDRARCANFMFVIKLWDEGYTGVACLPPLSESRKSNCYKL